MPRRLPMPSVSRCFGPLAATHRRCVRRRRLDQRTGPRVRGQARLKRTEEHDPHRHQVRDIVERMLKSTGRVGDTPTRPRPVARQGRSTHARNPPLNTETLRSGTGRCWSCGASGTTAARNGCVRSGFSPNGRGGCRLGTGLRPGCASGSNSRCPTRFERSAMSRPSTGCPGGACSRRWCASRRVGPLCCHTCGCTGWTRPGRVRCAGTRLMTAGGVRNRA